MKKVRLAAAGGILGLLTLSYVSHLSTQPSFNGSTPGCSGSGCHTAQSGILSVTTSNLKVSITLTGGTGNVAGELVDANGTVVASNNSTSSNPFDLTAPSAGTYTVNAGYKSPSRRYDSKSVTVSSTTTDVTEQLPLEFSLQQNYPNPFNPSTTITYRIASLSVVTMQVLDLTGKTVARLVNSESKAAGEYSVVFDARDLASGVYFYRISATPIGRETSSPPTSFVATKRLLLVK